MASVLTSRRALLAGAAAAAAGFGAVRAWPDRNPSDFRSRLVVGADTSSSVTVQWEGAESVLELRFSGAGAADSSLTRFTPEEEDVTLKGRTFRLRTVRLSGLSAGKTYEYRIAEAFGRHSEWTPLRTSLERNCRALLFPDSQSTDGYKTWAGLYRGAIGRTPDIDFTCNLGDLVDLGMSLSQWDDWLKAVSPGISRVPVAPVMGNHETYDMAPEQVIVRPDLYLRQFAPPGNGSASFPRWYYSFDSGPVRFIVLNTQWDEAEAVGMHGLLDEMKAWFLRTAADNPRPWCVVLMHRDVLRYGIRNRRAEGRGISSIGMELMPLFDRAGVDAVLTAHLHTYRRRGRIRGFRQGELGPLYILTGVAGNIRYNNFWLDHSLDIAKAPQPETDNYLLLEATPESLSLQCFLPDGKEIDRAVLRKAA